MDRKSQGFVGRIKNFHLMIASYSPTTPTDLFLYLHPESEHWREVLFSLLYLFL